MIYGTYGVVPPKKPEPPELSHQEREAFLGEQVDALRGRLAESGLTPAEIDTAASAARGRMEVVSRLLGPELKLRGSLATGREAMLVLTTELTKAAREVAHGGDPAALVAQQLAAAGVPLDEAQRLAQHRATRDEMGRVVLRIRPDNVLVASDPSDMRSVPILVRKLLEERSRIAPAEAPPAGDPLHYSL